MASLTDAEVASSADLAGGVTVGVASSTDAGVASLADAGVASLADLAGGVTVGVASPADAGVASLADLVEGVTVAVTSLADLDGGVNTGVALSAIAGLASLADIAEVTSSADLTGNVTIGVTFLADPVDVVTYGMTFQKKCGVLDGSVYDCDDYCDDSPGYWDNDEPGHFVVYPDVTLLADPVGVVIDGITFQERCDVLSDSVYDNDDYCDDTPDYFDCDKPGDFDGCPDVYGFIGPDESELCHGLRGPGDCGVYCMSRGDSGVMPYGTATGYSDNCENAIALHRTGSDQPVNYVIGAVCPGVPCEEDGLPRTWSDEPISDKDRPSQTGSDEPINSVVCMFGSDGLGGLGQMTELGR